VSHAPELDVGKALEELAALLRTIVPRGVVFELDLGRDLPAAEIEQHELERIVTNLVRNALEVVDDGDTIVVSASRTELEPDNDLGVDAGAYVVVGVFDSGPGVSAEHQGRLFVPFFTTKPEGLGLGLSSVDWLVRRRGGAVRVTSRPKASGTWFEAFLPVASDLT
jgi:signal transduction histidine kinase